MAEQTTISLKTFLLKLNQRFIGKLKYKIYFCKKFTNSEEMFDFTQYLGFILFLTVLTIGFWLLFFLVGFVTFWIGGASWELYKEKRDKKNK